MRRSDNTARRRSWIPVGLATLFAAAALSCGTDASRAVSAPSDIRDAPTSAPTLHVVGAAVGSIPNAADPIAYVVIVTGSAPAVGQTAQFTATAWEGWGGSENATARAAWTTSNPAVATVASGGVVRGIAAGQATISASFLGTTGSLTISVTGSTPAPGAAGTVVDCPRTAGDASDIRRSLYLPSFPGSALREVRVFLTARDVAGTYSVTMTVSVNDAQVASIGPVGVRIDAVRQSVQAAFAPAAALSIARGSTVRFQVQTPSAPGGGELAWEGVADTSCPVFQTSDGTSTASLGRAAPIQLFGN